MDQIGSVNRQDQNLGAIQKQQPKQADTEVVKEPKDKVEISKARKVVERVIGSPVAVLNSAANAVGGVLSGGASGVDKGGDSGESLQGVTAAAAYVGMGITAGVMLIGGWIPAVVGGVVGLGVGFLAAGSGSTNGIGEQIDKSVDKLVSDNEKTDRKLKDAARDFTEGAFAGAGIGAVEGFREGSGYGAGMVSGVIEGTKGVVSSALGKYETSEAKPEKPKNSLFKKILRIPRTVVGTALGVAGGVTGMALNTLDGAIQGTIAGAVDKPRAEKGFHRFMIRAQDGTGRRSCRIYGRRSLGSGNRRGHRLVSGQLIIRAERKSGKDEEMMKNLTQAVEYAEKDNSYEGKANEYGERTKNAYETFRDGIEGTMTGTVAGAREGFKTGYAAGKGVTDGVFDGVSGIFGAVTGK